MKTVMTKWGSCEKTTKYKSCIAFLFLMSVCEVDYFYRILKKKYISFKRTEHKLKFPDFNFRNQIPFSNQKLVQM